MSDLPTAAPCTESEQARHLRPVKLERRGPKFAAYAHDVARVLGPHRGAAAIYGLLASAWFEFAPPSDKLEGKKRPAPGDWVQVDYRDFKAIAGTRSKNSITRWLRILAEDTHPCLQGRCGAEHPLIVVKRQRQNKPNLYRKWRCGEDALVERRRVQSAALSAAAKRRVNTISRLDDQSSPSEPEPQLGLGLNASEFREPHHGASLYVIENIEKAAAEKDRAAAIDEQAADDVDAVACEVVDAILELAKRTEPEYTDDRAWSTARRLATAALKMAQGEAVAARSLLLRAIADRRLARAGNPVGLLIRGVEGDVAGADRFLVSRRRESDADGGGLMNSPAAPSALDDLAPGMRETLLDAVRSGAAIDARWLRGRDIPPAALGAAQKRAAKEASTSSETPLCDELAGRDETEYRRRLEEILAVVEIPKNLGVRRTLDHPMLLGMCRARLERELCGDR